tara:strand:- start:224 stop:1297 length:1074 start_codon:yes stop_codon:yes gene_type:complete
MSQTKVSNTFIDNNRPFRNIVINGDMQVSQRGDSTGVNSTGFYGPDRFKLFTADNAGAFSVSQSGTAPGDFGLNYSYKLACTTADTSVAASEYVFLQTSFETQNLQHLRKGLSDAKKLYLSFYAKADASLTYVVEVYDNEHDRVQSQTFAVTTSWQRFTFEIPADTNGETLANNNTAGISVHWWLHGGSNYTSGTLSGSWANRTNTNRAAGIGSVLASTDREFYLTGVQLELGGVSDFEHVPHDVQFQRCQRYFQKWQADQTYDQMGEGAAWSDTAFIWSYRLCPRMRAQPTAAATGNFAGAMVGNDRALSSIQINRTTVDVCQFTSAISDNNEQGTPGFCRDNNDGDAKIEFDAEL